MPNKNSRLDSRNKAFLTGVQWMMDSCTFGTGISDCFPSNEEMNLENLNKIRLDNEDNWKLKNIPVQELEDYKLELKECNLEDSEDNIILFLQGCLHWIQGQLLNEYMDWKFDDQE